MDDLVTMQEAAAILEVTYQTVYRYTRGKSPVLVPAEVKKSPRRTVSVMFRRADVEALKPPA